MLRREILWKRGMIYMRTILCVGDSNTHGYDPTDAGRYPYDVRWTGVLQQLLGREEYYVIEEGLNSRTTVLSDPVYDDNKSALDILPVLIKTHMPVDLCIIMLGTNDLKLRFSMQPCDIGRGLCLLSRTAQRVSAEKASSGAPCPVLLVAPPPITPDLLTGRCAAEFGSRAMELSGQLAEWVKLAAENTGAAFLDASVLLKPSSIDGLHLSPEGHRILAHAIAERVRDILGEPF